MSLTWTRRFVIAATLANSTVGTAGVNRVLIEFPAWQKTGAHAWASFSRLADLGPGRMVYPLEAIGGALLSLAAALSLRGARDAAPKAKTSIYAALFMSIGGLLVTTQAAPNMLRIARLSDDDSDALQAALDGFEFWSRIRAVLQFLAFAANVWSLAELSYDH